MHVYSADSDRGSKKVVFNALRPKMCMCPRNSGIDDSLIQSIKKKEKKRKKREKTQRTEGETTTTEDFVGGQGWCL